MRKHWKKGLLALIALVALIFALTSMGCAVGGDGGEKPLSPFQALNQTVYVHAKKITKAQQDIVTLNTGVAQLRDDLDAVVADMPTPAPAVNLSHVNARLTALENASSTYQIQIATLENQVDSMQTSIDNLWAFVNAISDNYNTVSYRLDVIETALNLSP